MPSSLGMLSVACPREVEWASSSLVKFEFRFSRALLLGLSSDSGAAGWRSFFAMLCQPPPAGASAMRRGALPGLARPGWGVRGWSRRGAYSGLARRLRSTRAVAPYAHACTVPRECHEAHGPDKTAGASSIWPHAMCELAGAPRMFADATATAPSAFARPSVGLAQ